MVRRVVGRGLTSLEQLFSGFGTALVAFVVVLVAVVTTALSLVGVGLILVLPVLRGIRILADRERARLGRWGPELVSPGPVPARRSDALADPTVRRELRWLAVHGTIGLAVALLGVVMIMSAVRDLVFPLLYPLLPRDATATSIGLGTASSWSVALAVPLIGLGWGIILLFVGPPLARIQLFPGRRLLVPDPRTDLSLRVAALTATRAAALDAHAAELRRIERSLHDGSQNRLVAVTVLLGAARRALARDPAAAAEVLDRAQDAAEEALAELRAVSRSILLPVLADRGLAGALTGLAGACGVPCEVEVDLPGRCAASTEATAYFVVAEALTNVAKHSGAGRATVSVRQREGRLYLRVTDDGHGGADAERGSGLVGIARRVEAHDGVLALSSPQGGPTTLEVELPCGS
ncbi:sensor histidine kinase [Cryptosporangium minutisporangium]|uniref:sensor histidine kinase n=1 Tax=Cryptosporangium minutisporangium TaxID=113569 RepID=UPI0035E82E43